MKVGNCDVSHDCVYVFQEQLKDFLEKKDSGQLTVQKKTNFLRTILKSVR